MSLFLIELWELDTNNKGDKTASQRKPATTTPLPATNRPSLCACAPAFLEPVLPQSPVPRGTQSPASGSARQGAAGEPRRVGRGQRGFLTLRGVVGWARGCGYLAIGRSPANPAVTPPTGVHS